MKAIKVNADYEVELFHGKTAPPIINHTIEFLALYLEDAPLWSTKNYSKEYLNHVASITRKEPRIVHSGPFENWWGPLKDLRVEREWNSKITSTQIIINQGWCKNTFIIHKAEDMSALKADVAYLLKDPYGMSGQRFQVLPQELDLQQKKELILKSLSYGSLIIEPLFHRIYDFSQYIFPDGKRIAYQNLVDSKFQYKGTVFKDYKDPTLENLPFFQRVSKKNWDNYKEQINQIIKSYKKLQNNAGFSIDSFVYEEGNEFKIRAMSEINYRRTMGRMSWELSSKYSGGKVWSGLYLFKYTGEEILWELLKYLENVKVLSPGDSRFEVLYLSARDEDEGIELLQKLRSLLPDAQFSIKL